MFFSRSPHEFRRVRSPDGGEGADAKDAQRQRVRRSRRGPTDRGRRRKGSGNAVASGRKTGIDTGSPRASHAAPNAERACESIPRHPGCFTRNISTGAAIAAAPGVNSRQIEKRSSRTGKRTGSNERRIQARTGCAQGERNPGACRLQFDLVQGRVRLPQRLHHFLMAGEQDHLAHTGELGQRAGGSAGTAACTRRSRAGAGHGKAPACARRSGG